MLGTTVRTWQMRQAEAAFPQAHNLAGKAGTLLFKAAQQLAGPKLRARRVAASSSETPVLFAFTCSQKLFLPILPESWYLSPAHLALDNGLAPSSSHHCLAAPSTDHCMTDPGFVLEGQPLGLMCGPSSINSSLC